MPQRNHDEGESLASSSFVKLSDTQVKAPSKFIATTAAAKKRVKAAMSRIMSLTLVDKAKPYFSGVSHFNMSKLSSYWQDPFHTLLNLPWFKFILVFFCCYLIIFIAFALIYWAVSNNCILGKDSLFSHALWLSSRTASTIGYNEIRPNPDCTGTNLLIILQVILSSLVDFILLGVVFARFSAPYKRASTVRFSEVCVLCRSEDGFWCLKLRVANIRKHQILQPKVRAVITAVDSITPSNYMFNDLHIEHQIQVETNLELGFPANVVHVIRPDSPLYNLSLQELDSRMMEILVFVDGVDAMTSRMMTARRAYSAMDMRINEHFVPLHLSVRSGKVGLDFADFDRTIPAADGPTPAAFGCLSGIMDPAHMSLQLRHQTFRKLAELLSDGSRPAVVAATNGPASTLDNFGQPPAFQPPLNAGSRDLGGAIVGAGEPSTSNGLLVTRSQEQPKTSGTLEMSALPLLRVSQLSPALAHEYLRRGPSPSTTPQPPHPNQDLLPVSTPEPQV